MKYLVKIRDKTQSIVQRFIREKGQKMWRKRIKNEKFTILCPNCIGGIIYNNLGMRFLSPTVNLWFYNNDFVQFLKNIDYYLQNNLVFHESEFNYPVATLGDIDVHFNHYKNEIEAVESWERRKKRINWDNLYIIVYERHGVTREDILRLKTIKCKRLIVLTEKEENCDIEYVYKISPSKKYYSEDKAFLYSDWIGLRTFEKQWDFVGWLNDEKIK